MGAAELIGIAASVSLLSGWRLYLCVLATGLAMHFGAWPLPEHLSALQQSQLVFLAGAAFVGIAFQPFAFMLVGLQCALWSYVRRTEAAPAKATFTRHPAVPAAPAAA